MERGFEGSGTDRPAEAAATPADAPTVVDVAQRVAAARATDGFARSIGVTEPTLHADRRDVGVDTLHAAARAALGEPVAFGNADQLATLRAETGSLVAARRADVFPEPN